MNASEEHTSTRPDKKPDIRLKAKTLTDDVSELLELYYKLATVTVTEKASSAISASLSVIVILFLLMFSLLFAGLGLGWYLGEKLNSVIAGYSIIAGIFLLLMITIIAIRKTFLFPRIRNAIIKKIYEQN